MKRRALLLFITFIATLLSTAAFLPPAHGANCVLNSGIFGHGRNNPVRAEEGTLDTGFSNARRKFFKLHSDHSVYRVVDSAPAKTYILKRYATKDDLLNDLRGLRLLKGGSSVLVAPFRRGPGTNMVVDDVRGRSLKSLLGDPAIPKPFLERAKEQYARAVKELEAHLRANYEVETLRFVEGGDRMPAFMARVIDPASGENVKLWIKPEQFIVRESSTAERIEMAIVDPY